MVSSGLRTEPNDSNGDNAALKSELENRNEEIENLKIELKARNDSAAVLKREFETRYSKLAGEHASMKRRSEATEPHLVALHREKALESRMATQTRELTLVLEKLSRSNSERITLARDLAAAQTGFNELGRAHAGLESAMEDARSKFAGLETEIRQREAERTDLLAQKERLDVQCSVQAQALSKATHQVRALYNSTSWNLTRPVRILKHGAIRLRNMAADLLRLFKAGKVAAMSRSANNRTSDGPQNILSTEVSRPTDHFDKSGKDGIKASEPTILRNVKITPLPGLEDLEPSEVQRITAAFDRAYYLAMHPDIQATGEDPFEHFMLVGWREGRDPSPDFSTTFYLKHGPDIAAAGINPFVHWVLHGIEENRQALSFHQRLFKMEYTPKVSAIVPNYNHARFLSRRIESILMQTYPNLEILILDDCSSDESRAVIERYCQEYPDRIHALFNQDNSGNVFKQWRKGLDNSDGQIVWICESDDFCELNFLEKLVPYFRDDSINLAFGRIQETDQDGNVGEGLDVYREGAEPSIWKHSLVRPARQWFANAFGVNNVIANVGGSLWRRGEILDSVWREAQTYSVVGDWYLYCNIAGGGQIAWEPEAISYFRRHETSTSASSFVRPSFYQELERFMLNLRRQWDVPEETVEKFYGKVVTQYSCAFNLEGSFGPLENYCDKYKILAQRRTQPHILIAFYGFIFGGGELFPVNLANHLHANGWLVSMMMFETKGANSDMRALLNPAIPVYDSAWVSQYGVDRFVAEAGISLIHSHTLGSELWFFEYWKIKTKIPYLVTLHGSYEATDRSDLPDERLARLVIGVSHFVYTADKNLEPLRVLALPRSMFTKLPNAMPVDPLPFPKTRANLGISSDAVVFTLVARGVPQKGWDVSIAAFIRLRQRHPGRALHLLLCGDGEEPDRHFKVRASDPDITFLGYQSRIHGLYRISDVAIVPTRFSGESFPLCIIQALQTGTPVVASRVAEIETMLAPPGQKPAGLLIEPSADNELFIRSLADAMEMMLSTAFRNEHAAAARILGEGYSMDGLVTVYGALYDELLASADRDAKHKTMI